ncbi:hypothetical protein CWS43_09725 [Rahnella sp. AA]|uniref:hypothetical protein n=1 Tax=Rahnella sp. AA TaxID=2057180 RepID=UPI000C33AB07|nr:hypothetical protein [Rahnella sp. AA]PKE30950.1 hypothetical protein CWS43_09725 [Rahnella sp. AA]
MFKFNMLVQQNYASFQDEAGRCVIVDSFDNKEFDVRFGTRSNSKLIGTVVADSDAELNERLEQVVADHL